jgi:uncharacterized membrane protein YsdA (DUF1294 family)
MEHFLSDLPVVVGGYFLLMNLIAFSSMGIDKHKARKNKWRIPEARLFLWALLGGSLGSVVGMRVFHHKTKHWYFKFGMPLILIVQIGLAVAFFWMTGR